MVLHALSETAIGGVLRTTVGWYGCWDGQVVLMLMLMRERYDMIILKLIGPR